MVAAARKLAVRLYQVLGQAVSYLEIAHIESSPQVPLARIKRLMDRGANRDRLGKVQRNGHVRG